MTIDASMLLCRLALTRRLLPGCDLAFLPSIKPSMSAPSFHFMCPLRGNIPEAVRPKQLSVDGKHGGQRAWRLSLTQFLATSSGNIVSRPKSSKKHLPQNVGDGLSGYCLQKGQTRAFQQYPFRG